MILRVMLLCLGLLLLVAHRPRPEPRVCLAFSARRVVGVEPWPVAYRQECREWGGS